ncbi:MAG: TIR domain-containing protein [Alphaproteobacteria bacterium]|nr:TIR domain-containing protein [Alphaproteobacteria bacterium]
MKAQNTAMIAERTAAATTPARAGAATAPATRRVVFLNHATPEDNAFVQWLGARLTAAGYTVWSDLLHLVGGERFWKDINEAIRLNTAIFLPILSPASIDPAKEGVHNEIAIATAVRREQKLDNFIVPLRLKPVPEIPAQLIQLNYIDFATNWADGLARLLERLDKSDIPRRDAPEQSAMLVWAASHAALAGAVLEREEVLQSNWFPIQSLPPRINLYGSPVSKEVWERAIGGLSLPCRSLLRLMVSFAPLEAVQAAAGPDVPVTLEYSIPTQDFLSGARHDGPEVRAFDARNIVTDIVRQAWEMFAAERGLQSHEMSHGACWYVPSGLLEKDKARFRDADGKARWRAMIGLRGKRKIRWHYAVSARPALTDPFRLVIRSHAVFSEDTKTLVTDTKRALRLRKWLCKSWWNDDFRDRLLGLMAYLSDSQPTIRLPLGGEAAAVVGSAPLAFHSPLTYARHDAGAEQETLEESDPEDETLGGADLAAGGADDADLDDDDPDDDEPEDGTDET